MAMVLAMTAFTGCAAGMVAMVACAAKLDGSDVRANWTEQLINGFAQICILIGIVLA